MGFKAASETKRISTLAVYVGLARVFVFNAVIAALVRTPAHVLVVVCVCFAVPLHVCFQIFTFEVLQELRMRNHYIALVLRALAHHTLRSILHLLLQITDPIFSAKLMAAYKTVRLSFFTAAKLLIADLAVALVFGLK